jgi:prevent-host-death family protein
VWTLQDAKNRFSEVVDAALHGRPQEVSRRGRPAVVVVSADDYARLLAEAGGRRGSFADHLMSFPGAAPAGDIDRVGVLPRDVSF